MTFLLGGEQEGDELPGAWLQSAAVVPGARPAVGSVRQACHGANGCSSLLTLALCPKMQEVPPLNDKDNKYMQ